MTYRFEGNVLDADRRELWAGGELVAVEPQVFDLLLLLIQNKNRVVSKDELIEQVWQGRIVSEATLSSRINFARRAVGDNGKDQTVIRTVVRRGFRFVADVTEDAEGEPGVRKSEDSLEHATSETIDTVSSQSAASGLPAAADYVAWKRPSSPLRPANETADTAPHDTHLSADDGQVSKRWRWIVIVVLAIAAVTGLQFRDTFMRTLSLQPESAPSKLARSLKDKPSIAVLPFINMSGDSEQEYFSDGITEDIMTGLSKFGLFFVVSRNSTFAYRGASVNIKKVARDLGVRYVLEGSIRKSGTRLRITAQLIDAVADKHIWAEKYDRELKDIFRVQDDITEGIVASVAPEFLSAEMRRAQRKRPQNLDAWDAFMRGYWHLLRFTRSDNAKAQRLLTKAIEIDPLRANYHAVLAVTNQMDALYGWGESRAESLQLALKIAQRGLALDDQDSQVIRAVGLVHLFSKKYEAALTYFKRAVEANPTEAENRALLGAVLGITGNYQAALQQFKQAMQLSPRDVHIATWYNYLAVAAFVAGREEDAAEWSRKAIEANPQFPGGYRSLAASSANLGRLKEAMVARKKLQELLPHVTIAQLRQNLPYFRKPADLERYLGGLRKAGLPQEVTIGE